MHCISDSVKIVLMRRGFSLVELSIVLVILGLLTGGILAGQSLIRAAELRSVIADFSRYHAAIYSFRDKYFALPGDMTNATRFWNSAGGDSTNATCYEAQTGTSTATCNGDGDGAIKNTLGNVERFSAWKHLANAGLVEGSYSGKTNAATGTYNAVRGSNVPAAKISNGYYDINKEDYVAASVSNFDLGQSFNMLSLFASATGGSGGNALRPEEAWNLDMKLDDGRPARGSILSTKKSNTNNPDCTTADTLDAAYELSLNHKNCVVRYGF